MPASNPPDSFAFRIGRLLAQDAVAAKPGERRVTYDVAVQITAAEKKKLQARARAEMRSVSNYVAKLVLEDLRRG